MNIGVATLSLVAAFSVCEMAVRMLYGDGTVLFPRYHTDYAYGPYRLRGIRPHTRFWHTSIDGSWEFVTNNRGFRDARDFAYEKPEGVLRILSLGDSHTQGYEVRQSATFSAVLERYLEARGRKAEVLNTGVSGFSNAEELAFLEHEGVRYAPDVVVVGFFENDFEDNLKAGLFAVDDQGALVERRHEHLPGVRIQNLIYSVPMVRWLSEHSYFYSLLFNNVWSFFKTRLAERAVGSTASSDASIGTPTGELEYAVATQTAVPETQVRLAAALLNRMQAVCRDRGIRLLVVDVPSHGNAGPPATSMPPLLVERLRAAGIETLPSSAFLEDFAGVVEMHVPHGHRHINELAHALIGTAIGRRLQQPSGNLPTSR